MPSSFLEHSKILDALPALAWQAGPDGRREWFNRAWIEFTGRSLDQERGEGWTGGVHPGDLPACLDAYRAARAERTVFRADYRLRDRDGRYRWISDRAAPLIGLGGQVEGFLGICQDIDEQKRAESRNDLLRAVDRWVIEERTVEDILAMVCHETALLFEVPLVWVGLKEPDGAVRAVADNGEASEYLKGIAIRWDNAPGGEGPTGQAIRSGMPQLASIREDGFSRWQETALIHGLESSLAIPLVAGNETLGALNLYSYSAEGFDEAPLAQLTAIANQLSVALLSALRHQRIHLQSTALETAADMIVITDRAGVIQYVNKSVTRVTGYQPDELLGKDPSVFKSGAQADSFYASLWSTVLEGKTWQGEVVNRRKDGRPYHQEQTITPILDEKGQITHFIAVQRDITERKEHEAQLSYLADHDVLTGLYNRSALKQALSVAAAAARRGHHCALLYLDLDQFKIVNDTLGHATGDRLLVTLSGALQRNVREDDMLARLGGDEFAILLHDVNEAQALVVAEKIRMLVHDFRYSEKGQTVDVGVSIGIALITGRTDDNEILAQADSACYVAKANGRNRAEVFHPEQGQMARLTEDTQWSLRLKNAFKEDRLSLVFQPIVRVNDRYIGHYEALIRLREQDGSLVPPGAFIPAAERLGLIRDVDRRVISLALRKVAQEAAQGTILRLAINLSAVAFHDDQTMRHIREEIAAHGIKPEWLTFEITETAAISNLNEARANIETLREMGCHFALDDFGSGFSSFFYLRYLPVDLVKIDGMFIRNLANDPVNQSIVRAMNDVVHAMGKQTIAEFVEDGEILAVLADIGVDYAQGYHFGKPAAELLRHLPAA